MINETQTEQNENGVFIQEQEQLSQDVWKVLGSRN